MTRVISKISILVGKKSLEYLFGSELFSLSCVTDFLELFCLSIYSLVFGRKYQVIQCRYFGFILYTTSSCLVLFHNLQLLQQSWTHLYLSSVKTYLCTLSVKLTLVKNWDNNGFHLICFPALRNYSPSFYGLNLKKIVLYTLSLFRVAYGLKASPITVIPSSLEVKLH